MKRDIKAELMTDGIENEAEALTVQQLIDKLSKIKDKEKQVFFVTYGLGFGITVNSLVEGDNGLVMMEIG